MKKILSGLILMICVLMVKGQTTGPQTLEMMERSPAGAKVLKVIRAINDTSNNVDEDFIRRYFQDAVIERAGIDEIMGSFNTDIPAEDGILSVYKVERPEYFRYELTCKGSKSGWLEIVFLIEEDQPYKIRGFTIDTIREPDDIGEPMDI